jgi:hypothetical protein
MIRFAAMSMLGGAMLAAAAMAEDASTREVYACKGLADSAARLACYDKAVGRLEAAEASGEVTTVSRADVEKVKRESFGFRIPSLPSFAARKDGQAAEEVTRVTEAVQSVSAGGRLRVTLQNGQVWSQIDDKKIRARDAASAEIFQAAMGSYKMKLDGGLAFRVKREQ